MKRRSRDIARISSTRPAVPLALAIALFEGAPAYINAPPSLPPPGPSSTTKSAPSMIVGIVLDHDHGVVEIAQMAQDGEQAARVGGMQAHGRFIERIEGADEQAAERTREMNPLRLAAGKRPRLAFEREIAEANLGQVSDAIFQFAENRRASIRDARDYAGCESIHCDSSLTDSLPMSAIEAPSMRTLSASGLSLLPEHTGQGTKRRYLASRMRTWVL